IYPEAYVTLAQPVCVGFTDDGCPLRWQNVRTDDGSAIPQCIQYCPRVRRPRPVVEAPVGVPTAGGGAPTATPVAQVPRNCQISVFPQRDLAGSPFTTGEDQSSLAGQLSTTVSSINVTQGTWYLFSE